MNEAPIWEGYAIGLHCRIVTTSPHGRLKCEKLEGLRWVDISADYFFLIFEQALIEMSQREGSGK